MKLRLQIEPRVVFLVTVHYDSSIIWLQKLIDIRENKGKWQLLIINYYYKVFL